MGNVYYFTPATGSASWNTGANWLKDDNTTGTVPGGVAGDSAYVMQGAADINSGLVAPTNILANLVFGGSFSGTVGTTGNTSDSLPMKATTWRVDCAATRIKLDFTTTDHIGYVLNTGDSADSGFSSVRIRGGNTASKLYVTGGSVGVATTRPGLTATLAEIDISGGTLELAAGVTCPTGTQNGGTLTVGCGMATLTQSNGELTTQGSGTITTLTVGNNAIINNRAAAGTDSVTTLILDDGSTGDVSVNPQPLQITNPILMYSNSTLKAFSPTQITAAAGAHMAVTLRACGMEDVTIEMGNDIALTITSG